MIVTLKIPSVEELTVMADVPVPPDAKAIDAGFEEAERAENEDDTARPMVPWKPPTDVRVMVGVEDPPCGTLRGEVLTETVKSDTGAETVTVVVVDFAVKPLLPVMTIEYWPVTRVGLVEIVRVDVPDTMRLVGLSVAVRPEGALAVRVTVPANPVMIGAATVTVEIAEEPWTMLREEGPLTVNWYWL